MGPAAGYPEGMLLNRLGLPGFGLPGFAWPRIGAAVVVALALVLAGGPSATAQPKKKKKGDDPAAAAFAEKYKSDDAKERAAAVESLKDTPDDKRLAIVSKYVVGKEKRADVIARAVTVLSKIKDADAIAALIVHAGKGKTDQRVVYLEALAHVRDDRVRAALLATLDDGDPMVRGMAAWGIGQHRALEALDPLLALLDDRHWQVQSAAMSSIYRLPDKDVLRERAVPRLVDFLENSRGRMRADAAHALSRITGKRLGSKPSKWRKFLAGEDVSARDDDPEDGVSGAASGYADEGGRPHFYGMEVTSNRVVLILDMSLSMNDPIEIDRDRLRRETSRRKAAVTGAGAEGREPPRKTGTKSGATTSRGGASSHVSIWRGSRRSC